MGKISSLSKTCDSSAQKKHGHSTSSILDPELTNKLKQMNQLLHEGGTIQKLTEAYLKESLGEGYEEFRDLMEKYVGGDAKDGKRNSKNFLGVRTLQLMGEMVGVVSAAPSETGSSEVEVSRPPGLEKKDLVRISLPMDQEGLAEDGLSQLVLPLWNWVLDGVLRLGGMEKDKAQARADEILKKRWVRVGVIPALELLGLPGFARFLAPVLGVWGIPVGAFIFALIHLIHAPPGLTTKEKFTQFLVRWFAATLISSLLPVALASFDPESLSFFDKFAEYSKGSSGWNQALWAYAGHVIYNLVMPKPYQLVLADDDFQKLKREILKVNGIKRKKRSSDADLDRQLRELLTRSQGKALNTKIVQKILRVLDFTGGNAPAGRIANLVNEWNRKKLQMPKKIDTSAGIPPGSITYIAMANQSKEDFEKHLPDLEEARRKASEEGRRLVLILDNGGPARLSPADISGEYRSLLSLLPDEFIKTVEQIPDFIENVLKRHHFDFQLQAMRKAYESILNSGVVFNWVQKCVSDFEAMLMQWIAQTHTRVILEDIQFQDWLSGFWKEGRRTRALEYFFSTGLRTPEQSLQYFQWMDEVVSAWSVYATNRNRRIVEQVLEASQKGYAVILLYGAAHFGILEALQERGSPVIQGRSSANQRKLMQTGGVGGISARLAIGDEISEEEKQKVYLQEPVCSVLGKISRRLGKKNTVQVFEFIGAIASRWEEREILELAQRGYDESEGYVKGWLRDHGTPEERKFFSDTVALGKEPLQEARENFKTVFQDYVDFLSQGDELSDQLPDVFLALGNPDLRAFIEFANTWKGIRDERGLRIPIVIAAGRGRGTIPLIEKTIVHYEALGTLTPAEKKRLEKGITDESFLESDILKFCFEKEGILSKFDEPELIHIEEQPSRVTVDTLVNSKQGVERLFLGRSDLKVELVTSPPLLLRVGATAQKTFEGTGWQILKVKTYPMDLKGLSDTELIELAGYLAGYPEKYTRLYPSLNKWSELRGTQHEHNQNVVSVPLTDQDWQLLRNVQQAFQKYLEQISVRYDTEKNVLVEGGSYAHFDAQNRSDLEYPSQEMAQVNILLDGNPITITVTDGQFSVPDSDEKKALYRLLGIKADQEQEFLKKWGDFIRARAEDLEFETTTLADGEYTFYFGDEKHLKEGYDFRSPYGNCVGDGKFFVNLKHLTNIPQEHRQADWIYGTSHEAMHEMSKKGDELHGVLTYQDIEILRTGLVQDISLIENSDDFKTAFLETLSSESRLVKQMRDEDVSLVHRLLDSRSLYFLDLRQRVMLKFMGWLTDNDALIENRAFDDYLSRRDISDAEVLRTFADILDKYLRDHPRLSRNTLDVLIEELSLSIYEQRGGEIQRLALELRMMYGFAQTGVADQVQRMERLAGDTFTHKEGIVLNIRDGEVRALSEEAAGISEDSVTLDTSLRDALSLRDASVHVEVASSDLSPQEKMRWGLGAALSVKKLWSLKANLKKAIQGRITDLRVPLKFAFDVRSLENPERAQEVLAMVHFLRQMKIDARFFDAKGDVDKDQHGLKDSDFWPMTNQNDIAGNLVLVMGGEKDQIRVK
ncbi:MAG: hypothetical protein HYS08_03775 [Chlamydiae bacterium]|nr:hypothetical protein [Chlamydiota bacterium]MBI3266915.1 hypothetical protein [Chlamydiota bacterium]